MYAACEATESEQLYPAPHATSPLTGTCEFGLSGSGFGFRVPGFGFRDSGSGFRISGFGFRVSGFGLRASGFGFRVHRDRQEDTLKTPNMMWFSRDA